MSAATSVPPSAGVSTPELPVKGGKPVRQSEKTAAVGPGASDAVVANLDSEGAVLDVRGDRGTSGTSVFWRRW
jgi:hypothetical protein